MNNMMKHNIGTYCELTMNGSYLAQFCETDSRSATQGISKLYEIMESFEKYFKCNSFTVSTSLTFRQLLLWT
jgi:hypothetical protein